jgi:hypothetical protein
VGEEHARSGWHRDLRRHFKLGRTATIEEFERIAADHPVFRVVAAS